MAAKKKKNNKKNFECVFSGLDRCICCRDFVREFFHREEKGLQPAEKKQSSQQKVISKEKSQTPTRVKR